MSVIKAKLAFFEVEKKCGGMHPTEANEAGFRKAPEALDAMDMSSTTSELVLAMVNTQMLFITLINKSIVASPAIRMNDTLQVDLA